VDIIAAASKQIIQKKMLQVRLIQAVTSDIKADPEESGLLSGL
jgi:hypothetical protein